MKKLFCLLLTVAMLVGVMCMAASAAVVFDFAEKTEVDSWTTEATTIKRDNGNLPQETDDDGTTYMHVEYTSDGVARYDRPLDSESYISLETHKYFIMRYRKEFFDATKTNYTYIETEYLAEHPAEQYAWFDGMIFSPSLQNDGEWHNVIYNMVDYYDGYSTDLKGEDESSDAPNSKGTFEWKSNITSFMIQPQALKTGNYIDYEFIAFAETEEDAYGVLAEKAAAMISKDLVLDADEISGNDDILTAVKNRVNTIAAKYGLTASDITLGNVQDATVDTDGKAVFTYKLKNGSYIYNKTGDAVLRIYAIELAADNSKIISGNNVNITATISESVTPTAYTWFRNSSASTVGATELDADGATLSETLVQVGTYYIYLVVSTADGTITSDFLKVTVEAPTEPIILRYNNEEIIELANNKGYSSVKSVLKDGVMHTDFDTNAVVDDHYYRTNNGTLMPEEYQFYLETYPYVKIKFKYTGTVGNIQFYTYTGADAKQDFKYVNGTSANVWNTATLDYSGYSYEGKLVRFMFWLWNSKNAGSSDIEYIAFFPNSAAGKAAWQAFDTDENGVASTVAGTSEAFMPCYDDVVDIFDAAQTNLNADETKALTEEAAKGVLTKAIEAAINDSKLEATYTVGDAYTTANGFKFDVTVTYGEKIEATSVVTQQLAVRNNELQPIIWRFNNQDVIDMWGTHGWSGSPKNIILKDGVAHIDGFSSDAHGITAYTLDIGDEQFSLDEYPYIKYKFRWNNTDAVTTVPYTQFYVYKAAGGSVYKQYNDSTEGEWTTASYDMSEVTGYTGDIAAARSIDLWFRHGSAVSTGYAEVEYIAFFPATEKGKAAWEAFDVVDGAASTVTGSSDEFLGNYESVNKVVSNIKTAYNAIKDERFAGKKAVKSKLDEIVEKAITDAGLFADDVTVVYGDPVIGNNTVTYNVTVYMGKTGQRNTVTETFVFNAQTKPVIWSFKNPEFNVEWTKDGGATVTFQNGLLNAAMKTADDNCNIVYRIPENERFELSEFPYVVIRYKSTHAGNLQFYPATSTSTNTEASGNFYHAFAMPSKTNEWNTWVIDALNPTAGKNNTAGTWSGVIDYLRIDFMRPYQEKKSVDIEYIGFFATKAEAEAYTLTSDGSDELNTAAKNAVDWDAFDELYEGLNDKESAKAKIEELLAAADIPESVHTYVEITGATAPDPDTADGKFGSFDYTIYFINGPIANATILTVDGSIAAMPKAEFTLLGTQIRTTGTQGLRFGFKLSKSIFGDADVTNVSYGAVVIPEALLNGAELTLATENIADVKGKNIFEETDDYIIYTAVVTNISEEHKNTRLSARAYVKYTFNGKDYTAYANFAKTASVADIEGLMNDGYENEPELKGHLTYESDTWLTPFWEGDTVYHELFWPVADKSIKGNGATYVDAETVVNLMYPVSDVLIVKNGTHTQDFVEGKDYYINAEGQLVIPKGSAIKVTAYDYYISDNNDDGLHGMVVSTSTDSTENGKKLFFKEGTYIQENFQYSISYRHNTEWPSDALNPDDDYDKDAFPKTRAKLEAGEAFTIGYYGDSITAGGNNTGNYATSPYTPRWSQMINARLAELYNYDEDVEINLVNKAVGGRDTNWGVNGDNNIKPGTFAKSEFEGSDPTLFILAFGMNDEGTGKTKFKSNIINIINQIHDIYPECEFLLVSNSMPNPLWGSTANRTQYESVLEEVVTELSAEGFTIDCAKLQSMHKQLLSTKAYRDMSGNNVNHQNDMLARLYAQTVLAYITDKN